MTAEEAKKINSQLNQLKTIAGELAEAEAFAEKTYNESKRRDCPSAFKYGCMIAITRIYALSIEKNIEEIKQIII